MANQQTQARVPPADAHFREMTRAPGFAWPTAILFVASMAGIATSSYFALAGRIPLWAGTILNGLSIYFLFSVVHDSSHGAISRNKWLNEAFGHIGMLFFGPLAPFNLARWIHMQHHRFTNDHVKDPDAFGHKIDLLTPLRWLNFDYFYTRFFLEQAGPMRQKFMGRLIVQILFVLAVASACTYAGHGLEMLMLWLLPTRISSALFVAVFICMPHAPFKATSQQDEYQASNIRAGWEWLLTPLMAYQNYHLVHHLYPTAPFYRMLKIWNARREYHLSKRPFFVRTFSIGRAAA
ncbi:Fatty acid desaturase [Solimonas aquatica]|uniref:Fatty acid desaturase n=1 Tax=Solimonas aquatica TaxID=489703 RepID=A0A1H9JG08_9GAMM|nr:fatty acid desaturase [Solimonas aquatica]SEQ85772.1 Fatty acid desaturase [Solimonas aquatica]